MRLRSRVEKLEQRYPASVHRRAVPTGSFVEFAEGLLAGTFTSEDIDSTDYTQMTFLGRLSALLVMLTPEHRAWCEANPWATRPEVEWARAGLSVPAMDACPSATSEIASEVLADETIRTDNLVPP